MNPRSKSLREKLQIRGWRGVAAAVLQGNVSCKRSVVFHIHRYPRSSRSEASQTSAPVQLAARLQRLMCSLEGSRTRLNV